MTECMSCETVRVEKIKAIYPHIVVSGDINKPLYSIHWYDIKKKTMCCAYSSYALGFVREWLQSYFEIVDNDIDKLICNQTEVKHGKWEYKPDIYDDSTYECSVCKESWTLITGTPQDNNMQYCSNCGAKMDKE